MHATWLESSMVLCAPDYYSTFKGKKINTTTQKGKRGRKGETLLEELLAKCGAQWSQHNFHYAMPCILSEAISYTCSSCVGRTGPIRSSLTSSTFVCVAVLTVQVLSLFLVVPYLLASIFHVLIGASIITSPMLTIYTELRICLD